MEAVPDPVGAEGAEGDEAPVAPVPEPGSESSEPVPELIGGRIVVGVDDSAQAAAALRWALAEAALREASVEVVHTWSPPMSALPFGATLSVPIDDVAVDATARKHVEEMVAEALATSPDPSVPVQVTILPGTPALTLVEVAADADLVVVGSHGRTGLSRLVLGSVAMAVVQHAPCPAVVVRTPPPED
jgi:nucleotide-binding universal stress UspA family protein